MTIPTTIFGSFTPSSVSDVQNSLIPNLRAFVMLRDQIARNHTWLSGEDLTQAPPAGVSMDPNYQAALNAAVTSLNTALQAVDLTLVLKVTGIF